MAPRKPRAPAASRPPPPLPAGLELTDVSRRRWRLGEPIGTGGFGRIYDGRPEPAGPAKPAYVIKVEPHANGPLFTEMHCYHRVARAADIDAWARGRGLRRLGMPHFVGSGSLEHGGERFRFLVIERFGTDLQKLLDRNGNRFPLPTVLHVGLQVIDVLEYLHNQEYIHGDIKGQNLLLGVEKGAENQVYLVDYGLACRFAWDGHHKPYKPDPRKAHNGTIEFASRDAHVGAQSRRGDLEVLGYNLLQWACGRLPWQDSLADPGRVAGQKERFMADVPSLMRACFPAGVVKGADAIQRYVEAVAALPFDAEPDYEALRATLRAGLRSLGSPPLRLVFSSAEEAASPRPSGRRRTRSPLLPVQESALPERGPQRAAARKPARRRAASAVSSQSEDEEEERSGRSGDEAGRPAPRPRPRARSGRGDGSGKRPSAHSGGNGRGRPRRAAETRKTPHCPRQAAVSGAEAGSTVYHNITPSMRAVLEQRAAAAATARRGGPSGVRGNARRAAAARSAVSSRGRRAAAAATAAAAPSSDDSDSSAGSWRESDEAESFYTPPSTAGRRRSGRLSAAGVRSPPAGRRRRGAAGVSPELW